MAIAVINQITERVVKGALNGQDPLTFTALSIVQVGLNPNTVDFNTPQDYKLTNGQVDWSPTGKEPTTGSSYYIVYTFQPPSSFKSFKQISDEMDVNLRALQPLATTQPGSVTRNLFIDLQATELAPLYASIKRVADIQSLLNLNKFEGTELDDFVANFQVFRGGVKFSNGFATFLANTPATTPILIPVGVRISTLSATTQGSIFFDTKIDGTIFPGQTSVTVPIQAEVAGAAGNAGSGTIVTLTSPILGIASVTNTDPTTGGVDQESDSSLASQFQNTFLANDSMTFRGIRTLALGEPNVIDALVVGAGDPLLVRGGGTGGKVDLYIQAEVNVGASKTDTVVYGGVDIPLIHQPVLSISSVFDNTTSSTVPPADYLLVKDVGVLAESVQANDVLRITAGVTSGDSLTITYVSNGVLESIQAFFDEDSQAVPARDFLTRAATQATIDIAATITLAPEADFGTVKAHIIDSVAGMIDNLKLGAVIRYKDVYDLIAGTTGVLDVQPLDLLAVRGFSSAATINLARNQFPVAGNIVIQQAS